MEGDTALFTLFIWRCAFQSTPSAWRETFSHSISGATPVFQSTPSAWRETVCHSRSPPDWNYFNPLPPHGGRPEREISISVFVSISIHSLRMEGDVGQSTPIQGLRDFNPLPPHGGRPNLRCTARNMRAFQSTPSAWRETGLPTHVVVCYGISIHSLRMEGDLMFTKYTLTCVISIHSLRMEGDNRGATATTLRVIFQSTPSAWRETLCSFLCRKRKLYFNPLPPHGGRRRNYHSRNATVGFQSTPSAWRETTLVITPRNSDRNFNPLPPHGGRL